MCSKTFVYLTNAGNINDFIGHSDGVYICYSFSKVNFLQSVTREINLTF